MIEVDTLLEGRTAGTALSKFLLIVDENSGLAGELLEALIPIQHRCGARHAKV